MDDTLIILISLCVVLLVVTGAALVSHTPLCQAICIWCAGKINLSAQESHLDDFIERVHYHGPKPSIEVRRVSIATLSQNNQSPGDRQEDPQAIELSQAHRYLVGSVRHC